MRVLMITPRVDEGHDILGFVVTWVNKLAEKIDKLYVISFGHGPAKLRKNVEHYSLDEKSNKIARMLYFSELMTRITPKADVVFCHMYPEFTLMATPFAKVFRKPVVTWYAHGHVNKMVKMASLLADKIVTSSEKSFRIKSKKSLIIGQGIDIDKFKTLHRNKDNGKIIILSVGRISPIKDYITLIKAANVLINKEGIKNIEFVIVGNVPMKSQENYYAMLMDELKRLKLEEHVKFVGSIPFTDIQKFYENSDLFVNMCPTGAPDKAVLEAMACGKPIVICNRIFRDLIKYDGLFGHGNFKEMADKLKFLIENPTTWDGIGEHNRAEVLKAHSLNHLTDNLVKVFDEVT